MNTQAKSKRYFVRIIHDDGSWSVMSHRDKTEFCKRTADKHGSEFYRDHGLMTYVVEA